VAPFPPGGTVDILSRAFAEELARGLGQAVVVENRGGAGGTLGAEQVARAPADGYALLFGAVHHAIAQSVYTKLGYDIRNLTPVGLLGRVNHAVIVPANLPVRTVSDLVSMLRAAPDMYSYATPGAGTMQHLMTEHFKAITGTVMTHIPYRGSGPAMVDLIAGNTQVMFETMPSALQHIKAGKVRAIAVTAAQRSDYLPSVPTVAESGFPTYDVTSWYGLYAPAKTTEAVVARLNGALNAAFRNKPFSDAWLRLGAEPSGSTPSELGKLTASEVEFWGAIDRRAHITVE
jgi:tripartite-type tricarboxylate transporter receptor subunit TctC